MSPSGIARCPRFLLQMAFTVETESLRFLLLKKSACTYTLLLLMLAAGIARAETIATPEPLSIKGAVAMALNGNRGLRMAKEQRNEVRARADAEADRLLPQVNASYSASRTDSPINVFGDRLLQKRFTSTDFAISRLNNPGTINNYHTELSVIVPVYHGGSLRAGKRAGNANARAAEWQYRGRRQATILHVIEICSLLRESQAERTATRRALRAARDHLADTRALKHRGLAIVSDVMDARARTLEVGITLQSASNAVASARDQLRRLLGLPTRALLSIIGTPKVVLPERNVDEWLETAIRNRPELHAAKHRLDAARARADAAMAPFLPTVNLRATEAWNSSTITPKNANTSITAEVRFNLFSGGSDRAHLRTARAITAARELALEDTAQAVHNDILVMWRNLQEAKSRIKANRQVLRQTLESLRIRTLREQQGLERTSDVLGAQSRADRARAEGIRARYALVIAKARLLAAAGQLTAKAIQ